MLITANTISMLSFAKEGVETVINGITYKRASDKLAQRSNSSTLMNPGDAFKIERTGLLERDVPGTQFTMACVIGTKIGSGAIKNIALSAILRQPIDADQELFNQWVKNWVAEGTPEGCLDRQTVVDNLFSAGINYNDAANYLSNLADADIRKGLLAIMKDSNLDDRAKETAFSAELAKSSARTIICSATTKFRVVDFVKDASGKFSVIPDEENKNAKRFYLFDIK